MCVIIHQPAGVELTKELAKTLWDINDDGAGYSFIRPDTHRIRVFKTMTWPQFWSVYRNDWCQYGDEANFMIHMRIATHGSVSLENCHPFWVNEHTVMFHNGVFKVVIPDEDTRSDSRVFAEDYLPTLRGDWLDSPWIQGLIEDWAGWSRIAFMTTDPDLNESLYIMNRGDWVDHQGLLLSNGTGTKWSKPYVAGSYPTAPYHHGNHYGYPTTADKVADPLDDIGGETASGHPFDRDDYEWDWAADGSCTLLTSKPVDFSMRRAILKESREDLGFTKPMAYNVQDDRFECLGCDEPVDEETGLCSCNDVWCIDCQHTGADCMCKRGWSIHLVPLTKLAAPLPTPGGGEAKAIGLIPLRKEEPRDTAQAG